MPHAWATLVCLGLLGAVPAPHPASEAGEPAQKKTVDTDRNEKERAASDRPSILLYLLDGLSGLEMTYLDYPHHTTPTLNVMMERSTVYLTAYSASPWTVPSVAAIFTSLYPSAHTLQRAGEMLPRSARTLAEVLKEEGYETAMFSSHPLVGPRSGLDQGFDWFEEIPGPFSPPGRSGPGETSVMLHERLLKWIDDRESTAPFFILALSMDPLEPFGVPGPGSTHFLSADELEWYRGIRAKLMELRPGPLCLATPQDLKRLEVDPDRFVRAARAVHDGAIRHNDRRIWDLRTALEKRELWEKILFLVTSTHGEEFGERGIFGHGASLSDQAVRVPVIISFPLLMKGPRQLRKATDHVDLMPTLLSLANIAIPEGVQGIERNLAVTNEMELFYKRSAHAEAIPMGELPTGRLSMIADAGTKLILYEEEPQGHERPEMELFRGTDPLGWEKRSVVAFAPRITSAKRLALNGWRASLGKPILQPDPSPPRPPSDLEEVLRSLGYLQGMKPLETHGTDGAEQGRPSSAE